MKDVNYDELVQDYLNKYRGRFEFAGPKHSRVKQVLNIAGNLKSNPKKMVVIEGIWAHEKARQYKLRVEAFMFCPELIYTPEALKLVDDFINTADNSYLVSKKVFSRLAEKDNSNGFLSVCYFPESDFDDIELTESNLVVVLDGLEIPGNIGTIIRTSDGCGVDAVIMCNQRIRTSHPKLIRSSHGANFKIPMVSAETEDVISWLVKNDFSIYLTDTRAEHSYFETEFKGKVAIIAGSERYGITKEWYNVPHNLISIPMLGDCDSLNVAVSTGIIIYEAALKQKGHINRG